MSTPCREDAIAQAMREHMLDDVYRGYVDSYLARDDPSWRMCCNSDCEPCVMQLGRVVDRVRQLLREPTLERTELEK